MTAAASDLDQYVGLNVFDALKRIEASGLSLGELSYVDSNVRRLTVLDIEPKAKDSPCVDLTVAGLNPVRYLPSLYNSNDFLKRMLMVFQHVSYGTTTIMDNQYRYFTPMEAPMEFVRWMASWFGVSLDTAENDESTRLLVQYAVPLFRRRGTASGLRTILKIVTGIEPQILENTMPYGPYVISGSAIDAHVLDERTARSYFTVHFPVPEEKMGKERVMHISKLIQDEKPAHTECFVTFQAPEKAARKTTTIDDSTIMGQDDGIIF